jgi:hypothetical protein
MERNKVSGKKKTGKTDALILLGAVGTVWPCVLGAQWLFDVSHGAMWGLAALISAGLVILFIWIKVLFKLKVDCE